MNENPLYFTKKKDIENNLREVYKKRENASKTKTISREELLILTHTYLIFDKNNINPNKKYKDLDEDLNKKANVIFDEKNTWKDKF
jgi:hypothetical protein